MRHASLFTIILLFLLTACQSAAAEAPQPIFTPGAQATITPIPLPAEGPHKAGTLPGVIWSFKISPDQSKIAFATSAGLVIYDLNSFELLRTLETGENVYSLEWSPDGKKLAIGLIRPFEDSGQAVLKIYETQNWKISLQPAFKDNLKNERILEISWKPDGSEIGISTDMHGVFILNSESGKVLSQETEFAGSVVDLAWSPDGSRLVATGDMAYGLRRWKVNGGQSVRLFDQRTSSSMSVEWTQDGKRLVSGHSNGVVCFWTAATNKCDGYIQAHRSAVFGMALSPDGTKLATSGGVFRIWDTQTGDQISAFGLDEKFIYSHLAWSQSGKVLAALQTGLEDQEINAVRLWEAATGKPIVEFMGGKRTAEP